MELFYFIASIAIGVMLGVLGVVACVEGERLEKKCSRLQRMNDGQRAAIEELQNRCWELEDILEEKGA